MKIEEMANVFLNSNDKLHFSKKYTLQKPKSFRVKKKLEK